MKKVFALFIPFLLPVCMYAQEKNPLPTIPKARPVDSETVGDWKTFPEMKLNLPIAKGPFEPTWESIEKTIPALLSGFVMPSLVFGFILATISRRKWRLVCP
jgi:hypothetical protein